MTIKRITDKTSIEDCISWGGQYIPVEKFKKMLFEEEENPLLFSLILDNI